MNNKNDFISIVIPVLNNLERLKRCIRCISIQDYPIGKFEVIVIDNGSKNLSSLKKFLTDFSFTRLFEFTGYKSPYPCRNIGISNALGDIIVLLDSNCFPAQNWLKEGVKSLNENKTDMVAGRIIFEFSDAYRISEIADSLVFVNVENSVKSGGLPGGNAFIRASAFEVNGLFDEEIRSNGDAIWSKRATRNGLTIGYCEKAIAFYPAKRLIQFLKKSFRIGYGSLRFWRMEGYSAIRIRRMNLENLRPYKMLVIKQLIIHRGELDMLDSLPRIWVCLWMGNLMRFLGRSTALLASMSFRDHTSNPGSN
ncbi:glycosyltransferase [Pedobacter miscanthi]|uniref:Glycosyltransferase 2-like domain-containing protein n=1 Tax=Pedobacter miscanthi TaxID=2259170 RepID=A0A366LC91_9SPHI|nr:glycosyltransferase [Pedobacter miscanthi]RBQ11501.1 hypothetical protein DRW42_03295 [Pedobacter miscanthi]